MISAERISIRNNHKKSIAAKLAAISLIVFNFGSQYFKFI